MNPQVLEQIITNWLNQQLAGMSLQTILQPLATAINRQSGRGSGGGSNNQKDSPNLIERIQKDFFRSLLTTIAPLTTLASILAQTTSGLSLFLGAINILTMTIAPVLLPIFAILGAIVLAIATQLEDELAPALDTFYEWLATEAVDALSGFVSWIKKVREGLIEFWEELTRERAPDEPAWVDRQADKIGEGLDQLGQNIVDNFPGLGHALGFKTTGEKEDEAIAAGEILPGMDEPFKPGAAGGRGDFGGDEKKKKSGFMNDFISGLKDISKQFRMENSPQAQMTGIVEASRAAQMAALNVTPFQQKQLQIAQKTAERLDRLVEIAEKRAKEKAAEE